LLIFVVDGFWQLALAMMLFSFFWNASLPQFEVVTLTYLKERVREYSRVRVWGSVGFIISVLLLGELIDRFDVTIVPYGIFIVYVSIWLASMTVKDIETPAHLDNQHSFFQILKKPSVIAFFVYCFLMQFGHGAYYAFYSIYMEDHGYSKSLIGMLWALGVIAEVVVFIFMHRLLERFGAGKVLMMSLLLAAVRWLLIAGFPEALPILIFAQLLHAFSFGTLHAAAVHIVHMAFKGRHSGRGMAMYSSLSFGLGGAMGSLLSGNLWDAAGPMVTFSIAAGISLLAAVISWRWYDPAYD